MNETGSSGKKVGIKNIAETFEKFFCEGEQRYERGARQAHESR